MGIFKFRKNKRYNYTPRYYKGKETGNLYNFDYKLSKYRETFNNNDFGSAWKQVREKMRTKTNRSISLRLIIIIFLLIFLFLYIIDFDLTIFTNN